MTTETSIGGPRRAFPTTLWSGVLRGGAGDPAERRRALEALFARYWKPVYCAVRYGWNLGSEDAKDAVQAFFADLLERDAFRGLDSRAGRFRSFLKASLKHFMLNAKRDAGRLKRGGGRAVVALDGLECVTADPGEPDEVLDAAWLKGVLERAVERLRDRLQAQGKPRYFDVFRMYDLSTSDRSYRSLADETGLSESDVRNYLHHARRLLREIVTEEVSTYAAGHEDVGDEVRWILG